MLYFKFPWFKFYFPLFWGMVMYDKEFKQRKIKYRPRIKLNCKLDIHVFILRNSVGGCLSEWGISLFLPIRRCGQAFKPKLISDLSFNKFSHVQLTLAIILFVNASHLKHVFFYVSKTGTGEGYSFYSPGNHFAWT